MEPRVMQDAHGNSFWESKTFILPEINLDPASDPLALDVKPKPEPSSVKLEPNDSEPLGAAIDNVSQLESTSVQERDPLDITDYIVPKMESTLERESLKRESRTMPRSPPRFVSFNSSTRQARSIEPSAVNIKTEPPSVIQESLLEGSDSTDNQEFDSVSSPCCSECFESESQNSSQHTSDNCLAARFNLTQCSVSLRRMSLSESSNHTASGTVSNQSAVKDFPLTSLALKPPRKTTNATSRILSCNVCHRTFRSLQAQQKHKLSHPKHHVACTECSGIFNTERDLEDHRLTHLKDFVCDVCGKRFSTPNYLREHRNGHSESQTCTFCKKMFWSKISLSDHLKIHDVNRITITCTVCGKSYPKDYYANHLKTHSKEFVCDLCGQKFSRKGGIEAHILNHLNVRDYACNLCGKSYGTYIIYKIHLKSHAKPYKCDICESSFVSKHQIKNHILVHLNQRERHACDECDRTFLTKMSVRRHRKRDHRKPTNCPEFPCSCCSKVLSSREDLTKHLKIHGLFCVSCSVMCRDVASFNSHFRDVHGGKTKVSCNKCGKIFNTREKLAKHEKSHIDKPFHCSLCHSKFVLKESFDLHMKKKHTVLQFNCDICAKTFICEQQVKDHKKCHDKPKKCKYCKKTFSTIRSLKQHVSNQHSTGPVSQSCVVCNRVFKNIITLKTHQRVHLKLHKCLEANCGRSFSTKKVLVSHGEVHISDKIHCCDVCDKSFGLKSNLILHKQMHEKNSIIHVCNECGKSCNGRNAMASHLKHMHGPKKLKITTIN